MPGKIERLFRPILAAATLIGIGNAAPAFSDQVTDQEFLLAPFNLLRDTPAGLAFLNANLATENDIYLNSTEAEKIAAGTALIPQFISANVLLRAFPDNPNFGYTPAGLPNAPALPVSVANAVNDILANQQINALKPYFGNVNIYGKAYTLLPGQTDPLGNPPPYQVSSAIFNNPFTPANSSLLAYQNQQTPGVFGVNWALGDSGIADFPSGHTLVSTMTALTYEVLAPGFYQQIAQGQAQFAYDLNVYAAHYPSDVIGGRILGIYVVAQTLSGNPLYPPGSAASTNVAALSQAMQAYLGGGSSSPYAAACAGNVAACVASGVIPSAASYVQQNQSYLYYLTYDLPAVGYTGAPPVVPSGASVLIATRFPYLSTAQLDDVLASTELPSGGAIDNGTGWARLNLFAAAGGYGAFQSNVTVNMNAALGGLNAFDVWSNAITGRGGLTLQGSGTLILAGNNSYTGGTNVQGGTLAVTGTLGGNLSISPGATFVGNGGYSVAANAGLNNAGRLIEVNTPLVNAGTASNTGVIVGDVANRGTFSNTALVTGAFSNAGVLSGNGTVGSLALLSGSLVTPSIIRVLGSLAVVPGATYQTPLVTSGVVPMQVGGTANLSGGTVAIVGTANDPRLGSAYPLLAAAGGISGGGFSALSQPAGLPGATRLDAMYAANAISLVVTPSSYGNLAAAGLSETPMESIIGSAVDAVRPPPGPDPTLFDALYALPSANIAAGLGELAPSIYPDVMITARNSWYLMADAVSRQLAARRGLAADANATTEPGPNGSIIWVSGLGGYDTIGAGGGAPGFTAGLHGTTAGIDSPVRGTGRIGIAVGTVEGQTWTQSNGNASNSTGQLLTYGEWWNGVLFADGQLGLLLQQETVHRTLPLFSVATRGSTNGLAGGGEVRVGAQQQLGDWLIEPSLGFGGFGLREASMTESGGALAETISHATLGSAESTLAVAAQHGFALSETVQMIVKAGVGWSHEFADNTASIVASFAGLGGSGFALNSAPIGRDAALVGLGADVKVASWPAAMFLGYGGAINGSSNAQSFNAGVRFTW